jgi:putative FmdB family regulatory protein
VPLYEYECKQCGHRFEKIMKFSDDPIKVCPKCGGEVEQMVSAPAVQFKGSGWYVTDYAKKSGGATPAKTGSSGDSSATGSESKPESKSDTSAPAGDSAKSSAPEAKPSAPGKKSDG